MSAANTLLSGGPEGGGFVVGDGGGLSSAQCFPSTTFFRALSIFTTVSKSRHRNEYLPTLKVGRNDRCCCLGPLRERCWKRRSRWPGALIYWRPVGLASAILRKCEIICLFRGTSEPFAHPARCAHCPFSLQSNRIGRRIPCPLEQTGQIACSTHAQLGESPANVHPDFSSRYSVSAFQLQPRHPRSGASPDRRSKPGPAKVQPPALASGGNGGRS